MLMIVLEKFMLGRLVLFGMICIMLSVVGMLNGGMLSWLVLILIVGSDVVVCLVVVVIVYGVSVSVVVIRWFGCVCVLMVVVGEVWFK